MVQFIVKEWKDKKYLALLISNNNYEGKIFISKAIKSDLDWWQNNSRIGINPIRTNQFSLEMSSDASTTGWGAYCQGLSSHGFWSVNEKKFSINYLELLAAFFALKCYASDLHDCEILLRVDNTSAISYINRAGGVQFVHLSELARRIWEWCEQRKLWVVASYIRS